MDIMTTPSENLYNRIIKDLHYRREEVLSGNTNCLAVPFTRFKKEFPGFERGRYYLITGATKSSKTQITNYLVLYNAVLASYYNPDLIHPKIFYYNYEETAENITLRFMAFMLFLTEGIRISPTDLRSTTRDNPVSEDILNLLEKEGFKNIMAHYEKVVEFRDSKNPTGVYKDIKAYAENNGITHKRKYKYKDELGQEKEAEAFDYYTPNDPKEYVFIIIDHVSLLTEERGMDLRSSINKLSEYLILFRNRYNYIPVVVQQQSVESSNLEAVKANRIRPSITSLSDSKYTAKDCDVMIGVTNPWSHEINTYLGYEVHRLKQYFRVLEVVINRAGAGNVICPLYFDGAINFFEELPLPTDGNTLKNFYSRIDNINSSKIKKVLMAFGKSNKSNIFVTLKKIKNGKHLFNSWKKWCR